MDHVTLGISRESDVAPKFGLTGTSYFFGFKDQDKILDAEAVARAGFDAVLPKPSRCFGSRQSWCFYLPSDAGYGGAGGVRR